MIDVTCTNCGRVLARRLEKLAGRARAEIHAKRNAAEKALAVRERRKPKPVHPATDHEVLSHSLVQRALFAWAQRSHRVYHCQCGGRVRHEFDPTHPHKIRAVDETPPEKRRASAHPDKTHP